MDNNQLILQGKAISKVFGYGKNQVIAVDNVDFAFHKGEVVSIVGASGSGKTTLAKMILGLLKPTRGEISYQGQPRDLRSYRSRRNYWLDVQGIFQDPFASFNLFFKVESLLQDCIKMRKTGSDSCDAVERMKEACCFVNLKFEEVCDKYPFELSGGQMQRLMIARIFLIHPKLLIADEPTSMIDACSRSIILEMLLKLKEKEGMSIIFITHDLGLAYYVSENIYIMERGRVVEAGSADEILLHPREVYTRQLIADVPKLNTPWFA